MHRSPGCDLKFVPAVSVLKHNLEAQELEKEMASPLTFVLVIPFSWDSGRQPGRLLSWLWGLAIDTEHAHRALSCSLTED